MKCTVSRRLLLSLLLLSPIISGLVVVVEAAFVAVVTNKKRPCFYYGQQQQRQQQLCQNNDNPITTTTSERRRRCCYANLHHPTTPTTVLLRAASKDEEEQENKDEQEQERQEEQPPIATDQPSSSLSVLSDSSSSTSLKFKYKSLSVVYGILSILLFLMPDRTLSMKLATKFGGAAGFGIAAAVAQMLSSFSSTNKPSRPGVAEVVDDETLIIEARTKKRLNLGLYGFSLMGLLAIPGEAGFLFEPGSAMILTTIMNTAKLWGVLVTFGSIVSSLDSYYVNNNNNNNNNKIPGGGNKAMIIIKDMWMGSISTISGLRVPQEAKKRSLFYRNCLLLVLTGMVSCLLEGIFYLRYFGTTLGRSLFDISLQWSAVGRLFLISSIIYTLKDLADHNQMTNGTNFVKLNLLVGVWAHIVGMGQSLSVVGYSHKRGLEMVAFSLLFLTKALKYTKIRFDEKKSSKTLKTGKAPSS